MASSGHTFLPVAEEEKLHGERLLNIDQKVLSRISKRLFASDSLILKKPVHLPTPPPDASDVDEAAASKATSEAEILEQRRQWREEMLLDFALLESNMVRIQLLRNSNERERERYAAKKVEIMDMAQRIRENNTQLRQQLEEAQKLLASRKEYDVLADKILSNRMLRPREDQNAQLEKLNGEIAELERESEEYAQTWRERQEQFGRIVDAGKDMLRLIRDEKEEAERKEGMEMDEEDDAAKDNSSTKGAVSAIGSPHPSELERGGTPLPGGAKDESGSSQDRNLLRPIPGSKAGSRATSPARIATRSGTPSRSAVEQDVEMGEADREHSNHDSEIEEGEEPEDGEEGEDTTERMEVSR